MEDVDIRDGKDPSNSKPKAKPKSKGRRRGRGKSNSNGMQEIHPAILTASYGGANDVSWYKNLPDLYADVANYSFNSTVGLPWMLRNGRNLYGKDLDVGTAGHETSRTAPGIMTIKVAPSIGVSTGPTSAINLAAQRLYSRIRQANSGAKNYDPTDVMLVGMGLDSAYMLYEILLRLYRSLMRYNYANRYFPNWVVAAQGFSQNLQDELANFRAVLDLFAYKLASINFPDKFDIIKRHSWLFTNIYTDSAQHKSQLYMFIPDGLFVYTEATQEGESAYLSYQSMSDLFGSSIPETIDLNRIQGAIDKIMTPLLGSYDVGVISGDIAKAFGESELIKFSPVESYPMITPAYNPEVLSSIENLEIPAYRPFTQDWNITVNYDNVKAGPYLVHQPYVSVGYGGQAEGNFLGANYSAARRHLLNMHKDAPNGDDVMAATRLKSLTVNGGPSTGYPYGKYAIQSCGSEVVVDVRMHVLDTTKNNVVTYPWSTDIAADPTSTNATLSGFGYYALPLWSAFDWAPTGYTWQVTENGATTGPILCDLDNYIFMDESDVVRLNDVAIMSLFAPKGM